MKHLVQLTRSRRTGILYNYSLGKIRLDYVKCLLCCQDYVY